MKDSAYVSGSSTKSANYSNHHYNERIVNFDENSASTKNPQDSSSIILQLPSYRSSLSGSSYLAKSNTLVDKKNTGNNIDKLKVFRFNKIHQKKMEHAIVSDDLSCQTVTDISLIKNNKYIKNIDDLKKVLPKVKISENEMNVSNVENENYNFSDEIKTTSTEQSKLRMESYCRTCAGLKIPLVDIFGQKGIQMRLNQQMKHLEHIDKNDGLPTRICMDCICDLKMSYKFFMQIKKAEVKLKSIRMSLNSVNTRQKEIKFDKSMIKISSKFEEVIENPERENKSEFSQVIIDSGFKISEDSCKHLISDAIVPESTKHLSKSNCVKQFDSDNSTLSMAKCNDLQLDVDLDTNSDSLQSENAGMSRTKIYYAFEGKSSAEIEKKLKEKELDHQNNLELDTYIKPGVCTIKQSNSTIEPEFNLFLEENLKESDMMKKKVPLDSLNNEESLIKEPKLNREIMYVTVKGSKPNQLLLVKVKKMNKTDDKKGGNCSIENSADFKLTEKSCKTSYKDIYNNRTKEIENRGAIIEEQIEEYKKKREKFLGVVSSSHDAYDTENGINFIDINNLDKEYSSPLKIQQLNQTESISDNKNNNLVDSKRIKNPFFCIIDSNHKRNDESMSEHSTSVATTKPKSEKNNLKIELLNNESIDFIGKENINKLSRILGKNGKTLLEFREYLKQRKIVIDRLKDQDVIALYEDLNSATNYKKPTDTNVENLIVNPTNEINLHDCDYCLGMFNSREDLEEHVKNHDLKIFFFCEDCKSEFSTNKAKRAHSITCIKKLICKYCDFVLESKGKKRQHEQKHCDAIYGQLCDTCGEKFKHQGTLDQHIKTQHMSWEKIFQCPKCPKKFAFKQKLSFHVKSVHTTLRAYLCEDCGADFKNPASLRHHRIRKHQPSSNKRECQVCHKVVPFYSLSKHMYTHKAYTIKCPHCDKMFKNSSTLKQHLRIHEDQRPYRCEHCGAGFNRRDGLRLHMRVHLKSNSRALRECSCQICSEKFPNHSMLVIHRNRVHKDGKQYTCHICNRSMLSSRSLEWHMSHIHNQVPPGISRDQIEPTLEKKRVSCNHCNKTFKTEMILRTHIKNTHMQKNPVKCLDCDLMFTSEVRLKHHMMIAHNRFEGTLTCPHCPKRFVNQLRLKTHMISHSEDRPYTCEICGFNLKTKIQLIKHHQNKHSDERPLQCRFCSWRCKQVSALVCHERTHTNERPYSCIVCKQRFKYLGDKNKHQRRHESLGGSGFKRIVTGRNLKQLRNHEAENSSSDQEQLELDGEYRATATDEQKFEEKIVHEIKYEDHETIKFETAEIDGEYEQEYDETSGEVSDSTEVIMSIEDTSVYTEEVTADNIEHTEIIADDITNHILQPGTIVHLRQKDENGKVQVIPVMLSLPDLTESGTEVNLTTASIIYGN